MIGWMGESVEDASRRICRGLSDLDKAICAAIRPGNPLKDKLTEAERERIRQSLWRLRRDLEELSIPNLIDDISALFNNLFGGPDGFVQAIRGWADLVDTLVAEAECDYGAQPGRGSKKKRHVKGALLYLARRSQVDIPRVPAFIEPLVWEAILDPVIDVIAQLRNRHGSWGDVPRSPTFKARLNSGAQTVGGGVDSVAEWLTRIAWSLAFLLSPVSPRLKAAVDKFLRVNPKPVETALALASWLVSHTAQLVTLSDLLAVAVNEARFVIHQDEAGRKVYARELMLAFLADEMDLRDTNSLTFQLLSAIIDVGIDVVSMLLDKHSTPASRAATDG